MEISSPIKKMCAREARTGGTVYQAASDGFIGGYLADLIGNEILKITVKVENINPPTIIVQRTELAHHIDSFPFFWGIRKNDYYWVEFAGVLTDYAYYWIPLK
jgi:hypothetical protein